MDTKPHVRSPDLSGLPEDIRDALSVVIELRYLVKHKIPGDNSFVELAHAEELFKKHGVDPDKFYDRD